MQRRIKELESELAEVSIKQPPSQNPPVELAPSLTDPFSTQPEDTVTTSTRLAGTFHVHNESSECGAGRDGIPRSVTHKTRVFGQSHWINGIVLVSWIFMLQVLTYGESLYLSGRRDKIYGGVIMH